MSVPNQKHITVNKEKCNSDNLYAAINLNAMNNAAIALDAGAFKLWCYFAKNQNQYSFELSSKAVERDFGIKIKQYNNAIKELTDKGYLVNTKGNNYIFNEIAVITKEDNAVNTKSNNELLPKETTQLLPKDIRNITDTTPNTKDNTRETKPKEEEKEVIYGTYENPITAHREWFIERYNELSEQLANGSYKYKGKYYKVGK